jgi:site-specific recombinase XerC
MLTGVRIGELAELEVDDVRLTQRTGELVIRHGKGDRRRVVPLSRPARAALREWLVDRAGHHSRPGNTRGPVWISRTGEQLSVRSISTAVTAVMAQAGFKSLRTHCVVASRPGSCAITLMTSSWLPTSSGMPPSRPRAATHGSDLEQRRAALEDLAHDGDPGGDRVFKSTN